MVGVLVGFVCQRNEYFPHVIASLIGETQTQMTALNYIENDVLKLTEKWIPLSSSHTVSGMVSQSSETVEQTSNNGE